MKVTFDGARYIKLVTRSLRRFAPWFCSVIHYAKLRLLRGVPCRVKSFVRLAARLTLRMTCWMYVQLKVHSYTRRSLNTQTPQEFDGVLARLLRDDTWNVYVVLSVSFRAIAIRLLLTAGTAQSPNCHPELAEVLEREQKTRSVFRTDPKPRRTAVGWATKGSRNEFDLSYHINCYLKRCKKAKNGLKIPKKGQKKVPPPACRDWQAEKSRAMYLRVGISRPVPQWW